MYVSLDKMRSIVYMGISLILHQKPTTYLYARCCALYAIFLYNYWLELTSLSLPSTPESVTIKKSLTLPLNGPCKATHIPLAATIAWYLKPCWCLWPE